jgi:hypothetical protein
MRTNLVEPKPVRVAVLAHNDGVVPPARRGHNLLPLQRCAARPIIGGYSLLTWHMRPRPLFKASARMCNTYIIYCE